MKNWPGLFPRRALRHLVFPRLSVYVFKDLQVFEQRAREDLPGPGILGSPAKRIPKGTQWVWLFAGAAYRAPDARSMAASLMTCGDPVLRTPAAAPSLCMF